MKDADFKIQILIERGKFKEAEAQIRARLMEDPNDPYLHLMLARTLVHLDRPREAETAAKSAIGLDPESGFPHEVLARILIELSDTKGAEDAVRQANTLEGDGANRRAILARIAADRGHYEQCLDHAQAGLAMDPDEDSCRFFRGIALSRLGRHDEADQETLGLLRDDPDDSSNHSARGWILLEKNATDEAKMHFQEALRLDPDNEDARNGLARCLQQGNPILGWMLRAIIALDRIPFFKMLLLGIFLGVILPRFLKGDAMPIAVVIVGQVMKTGLLTFFYIAVAVEPIFNALLFVSREGRNALGSYEMRAVKWSIGPLVAGMVYLVLWIAGGGKSLPVAGLGWLCTSTLVFESISLRHPWMRQRMLVIAGLGCGCAVWLTLGPGWLLKPMVVDLSKQLTESIREPDSKRLKAQIRTQIAQIARMKNQAFNYPTLALYLATAYSGSFIAYLRRKAPDDAD